MSILGLNSQGGLLINRFYFLSGYVLSSPYYINLNLKVNTKIARIQPT